MQLKNWWILLITLALSSCNSPGPSVEGCVVDGSASGFQCVKDKKKRFVPIEEGKHLICASPYDLEDLLKACKQGQVLHVTTCQLSKGLNTFMCTNGVELNFKDADNYFCMRSQDYKRVHQRCKTDGEHVYEYINELFYY